MTRSAYFDNARAILIFLVVFGHFIAGFVMKDHTIASIYLVIFTFHMPAFILISGYFAKKVYTPGYIPKLVKKLLLPYAVFQILYTAYYMYIFGDNVTFGLFVPRWALWFLMSLFLWNVLLYFFGKMKYGVVISIIVSLIIGYDDQVEEFLSLSRTIFFFPFFLVGYHLTQQHFEKIKSKSHVLLGAVLAVVVCTIIYLYIPIEARGWLLGKRSYGTVSSLPTELAWVGRLIAYAVTALVTYIFLTLVPTKQMPFTKIGTVTLSIYLMHMAVIRYLMDSPLKSYVIETGQYWILFVISVGLVYILSRPPVVKLIDTLSMANFKWNSKEKVS